MAASRTPRVEIEYCTGCHWLMRAGWTAQELLTTFESELAEVALVPGQTAGVFIVRLDGETLFDRSQAGRFPELRELKQIIRDRVAPGRSLGHSDRPGSDPTAFASPSEEEIS
jgi:selenoprotein W-related protein